MELETAFYITGIVFMVTMLLLVIAMLAAVLVIKAKIEHVQHEISTKVNAVRDVADRGAAILGTIKHFVKK